MLCAAWSAAIDCSMHSFLSCLPFTFLAVKLSHFSAAAVSTLAWWTPCQSFDRGTVVLSYLLSLYATAVPRHEVQLRLHELGLWTACHMSALHRRGRPTACVRLYRGCRAGRQRCIAPSLRPTGNGACVVSAPRSTRCTTTIVTLAFTWTFMSLWGHTSSRPSLPALPFCVSYEALANPSPDPFSSRWYHYSFCHDWITEMQPSPQYSAIPAQASAVGNGLRCLAGFPIVEVRPHHSAPSWTLLVEGGREDWLQACSPYLQVSHRRALLMNFVSRRISRHDVDYVPPRCHR